jgi:hypothetical protein
LGRYCPFAFPSGNVTVCAKPTARVDVKQSLLIVAMDCPMRESLLGLRPLDSQRGVSRGKSRLGGGKVA